MALLHIFHFELIFLTLILRYTMVTVEVLILIHFPDLFPYISLL